MFGLFEKLLFIKFDDLNKTCQQTFVGAFESNKLESSKFLYCFSIEMHYLQVLQ
jgi:hypothetical protein